MRILGLAAVLAVLLPAGVGALTIERMTRVMSSGLPQSYEVVAGQALVKFSSGTPAAQKAAALSGIGASVANEIGGMGWTAVALPSGVSVAAGVAMLKTLPAIEAAEPENVYRPTRTPSDPQVGGQYGLSRVHAFDAWDFDTGGTNLVTVAMVDTGIDGTQADLQNKLAGVSQAFDPNNNGAQSVNNAPTAACNHGTRTASVAAAEANNAIGIAGMAWGAKLISLKVFNGAFCTAECGGAGCVTTDQAIINAVNYARGEQNSVALGKIVLNLSVGGAGACGTLLKNALNDAVTAGLPVVISAGNDGGAVNAPANCATSSGGTGIIPVGATDVNDNIASFSSRGPELLANGVVAPGVNILVDDVGGGIASASGTSFSAPFVSGAAALILSAKPAATPSEVQSIIRRTTLNTGISALGLSSGGGVMNAGRAVRLAATGSAGNDEFDTKAFAYPNPFKPSDTPSVTINLPKGFEGASRTLKIFTIGGQIVRTLSGLTWDGKNDGGRLVASGTYIFSITIGGTTKRGRLALIR